MNRERQLLANQGVPYARTMDKKLVKRFFQKSPFQGDLGWRWKYIKPVLTSRSEARNVFFMLTSPVRNFKKIKNKKDRRKVLNFKKNVIVTLTTSPIRLPKIVAVLATLDLEYVTKINIVLPEKYGSKKEEYGPIPKDLFAPEFENKVNIVRIPEDYGPITKMLPTIEEYKNTNSLVISIDDDVCYPMGMIRELIYQKIVKHPRDVLTMGAESMPFYSLVKGMKKWWPERKQKRPFIDLVEGWSSILYNPKLVNTECMLKLSQLSKKCMLSDDFVISYALAVGKVKRARINNKYAYNPFPYAYGGGEDALHAGRGLDDGKKRKHSLEGLDEVNLEKYIACLENISEYVRRVKKGNEKDVCKIVKK